jgi:hypothetical protein
LAGLDASSNNILEKEELYDFFFSLSFAKIVGVSILCAIVLSAFLPAPRTATIAMYACLSVLTIVRFPHYLRRLTFGEVTFSWKYLFIGIGIGIAGGLLQALPAGFCMNAACSSDHFRLNDAALLGVVGVLGPVAETLLFNGGVQTAVTRLTGSRMFGLLGGGFLFVAAHGQFSPFIIAMGFAFAFLRYRTAPLLTIMVAHSVTNAVTYAIAAR